MVVWVKLFVLDIEFEELKCCLFRVIKLWVLMRDDVFMDEDFFYVIVDDSLNVLKVVLVCESF